jgi:hypothetical protein
VWLEDGGKGDQQVPRATRPESDLLRQEARALELLAEEVDVPPERLEAYWDISADLLNLVADIEAYQARAGHPEPDAPELLALRRRARQIASRLVAIGH